MAHQDALDDEILTAGRHRIGRNLPASRAQPIGKIIKSEIVSCSIPERPADRWNSPMPVVNDSKWPHLRYFSGEVVGYVITGILNPPVTFESQAQKIVILADDLPRRPRK